MVSASWVCGARRCRGTEQGSAHPSFSRTLILPPLWCVRRARGAYCHHCGAYVGRGAHTATTVVRASGAGRVLPPLWCVTAMSYHICGSTAREGSGSAHPRLCPLPITLDRAPLPLTLGCALCRSPSAAPRGYAVRCVFTLSARRRFLRSLACRRRARRISSAFGCRARTSRTKRSKKPGRVTT